MAGKVPTAGRDKVPDRVGMVGRDRTDSKGRKVATVGKAAGRRIAAAPPVAIPTTPATTVRVSAAGKAVPARRIAKADRTGRALVGVPPREMIPTTPVIEPQE